MKKLAWKLTYGGTYFITRHIEDITAEISESSVGDKYEIEKIEITDEELSALPDFTGF